MNLLLDTHAFIWFLDGDSKLSGLARQTIENPENKIYISTASVWEILIKQSLNKIILKGTLNDMKEQFVQNGFELLPISFNHAIVLQELEYFHRDPFDRMIIAQAKAENLRIVTKDQNFSQYPVSLIW